MGKGENGNKSWALFWGPPRLFGWGGGLVKTLSTTATFAELESCPTPKSDPPVFGIYNLHERMTVLTDELSSDSRPVFSCFTWNLYGGFVRKDVKRAAIIIPAKQHFFFFNYCSASQTRTSKCELPTYIGPEPDIPDPWFYILFFSLFGSLIFYFFFYCCV